MLRIGRGFVSIMGCFRCVLEEERRWGDTLDLEGVAGLDIWSVGIVEMNGLRVVWNGDELGSDKVKKKYYDEEIEHDDDVVGMAGTRCRGRK